MFLTFSKRYPLNIAPYVYQISQTLTFRNIYLLKYYVNTNKLIFYYYIYKMLKSLLSTAPFAMRIHRFCFR